MRALSKAGIAPCQSAVYHRAAYFANVLAGVYDFQPPAEVVMRHARGPFYPKIQSDLDWLCLTQYASVSEISYEKKEDIWSRTGIYDITDKGFLICKKFSDEVMWARDASHFLNDLAIAMAMNEDESYETAQAQDFTYNRPSSEPAPIIGFMNPATNKSLLASEELRNRVPASLKPIPQKTLRLYLRYLNKAAA